MVCEFTAKSVLIIIVTIVKSKEMHMEDKKRKTDLNFKLANYMRNRLYEAYKAQNVEKTNKTIDLLGRSLEYFRKWILHQVYGELTLEKYGTIWCLDHCYPLSKANLSNENDMYKSISWIILRPMCGKDNIINGDKIDKRLFLLQEIKGNYFMKLNGQDGEN